MWFSGCNKHSTARTPQVIQLPAAARFRHNDSTDKEVSASLWDYRNCRQIPNKPSASISATNKAVRNFRPPFLCFPSFILKTDIRTLKTQRRHYCSYQHNTIYLTTNSSGSSPGTYHLPFQADQRENFPHAEFGRLLKYSFTYVSFCHASEAPQRRVKLEL